MQIRLVIGEKVVTGILVESATARDFLSLLPMTLTLEDYASTEKIGYLPRKLSTAGAPPGSDPRIGSIAYYVPWGNIAFFCKDAPYAPGLITLGRIEAGGEVLAASGSLKARIEPVSR